MNTAILLAAQAAGKQGSAMPMIVMMLFIGVIMWFFMIRPQQKKQKQIRAFQNALKEGDSVDTGGGIFCKVKCIDINSNKIEVEIARGVVITVDKGYVFADAEAMRMGQNK